DTDFTVKMIRDAVTSPDGKTVVFRALGYLWKKELPGGIPVRLTNNTDFEAEPAFSSDGTEILFVTWNDEHLGAIHRVSVYGGASIKITSEKGIYRTRSFSKDGKNIVYRKEGGNTDQ